MKLRRLLFSAVLLVLFLSSPLAGQEKFVLKADGRPIDDFLKEVARITGKNLLLDPSVSGTVTIVSPGPLTRDEVWEVAKSALSLNGCTTVEYGAIVKIVSKEKAASEAVPTLLPPSHAKESDAVVTAIIDLRYIPPASVVESASALLGPAGNAAVAPGGKSLVIVDSEANVDRIRSLIARLDTKEDALDVVAIPLERAGAAEVASLLTQLFDKSGGVKGAGCRCRFTSEPRSNSLIIRAPAEERAAAKKIAVKLDRGEVTVSIARLRNMDAREARDLLRSLTAGS